MSYKSKALNALYETLNSWLGAISGTSKNIIVLDDTIFQAKTEEKFAQMFADLCDHLAISRICVHSSVFDAHLLCELAQQSAVKFERNLVNEKREGATFISLDGHGFFMSQNIEAQLSGEVAQVRLLEREEVVEILMAL